jgi:hypothetical protein
MVWFWVRVCGPVFAHWILEVISCSITSSFNDLTTVFIHEFHDLFVFTALLFRPPALGGRLPSCAIGPGFQLFLSRLYNKLHEEAHGNGMTRQHYEGVRYTISHTANCTRTWDGISTIE